jgi:phage/plasmid-like protein (TIGR03299 family)
MPAYFDTGFSVRKPMWHGLGMVADEYPESWEQARTWAGLDWEPTYLDLFVPRMVDDGDQVPQGSTATAGGQLELVGEPGEERLVARGRQMVHVPVDGHRAIARDDTLDVLATPKDSFELIYHQQMGELLDAYTEAWRKAGATVKFETAGSVRGGRMVWALVYLDEPYTVPGDESATYPFAALLNAHDGTAACKLLPTQVRVVCWNTWNAASAAGDRTGHQVVIRHTGNVSDRLESAKAGLATMRDEAKAWQVLATDLAAINVSDAVVQMFLDEFIPVPENATERTRNQRVERQATFRKLYEESPTQDGVRGTAYGLVQAAGEYLDHLRPFRSSDTYLARTMFTPEPIKPAVIKLVRELATA